MSGVSKIDSEPVGAPVTIRTKMLGLIAVALLLVLTAGVASPAHSTVIPDPPVIVETPPPDPVVAPDPVPQPNPVPVETEAPVPPETTPPAPVPVIPAPATSEPVPSAGSANTGGSEVPPRTGTNGTGRAPSQTPVAETPAQPPLLTPVPAPEPSPSASPRSTPSASPDTEVAVRTDDSGMRSTSGNSPLASAALSASLLGIGGLAVWLLVHRRVFAGRLPRGTLRRN